MSNVLYRNPTTSQGTITMPETKQNCNVCEALGLDCAGCECEDLFASMAPTESNQPESHPVYEEMKMLRYIRKDKFLTFQYTNYRVSAVILFNTYVLDNSVAEREYQQS
jgi:hypothetical protein